ncbi:MAG TPA: cation diffusion facilitator family transporter [Steroidobacteraceae bacterium]|jgi:cobalt-zinc-cadmium efflux system protein|nr:cation diffusion facilitator family transporter [Steroidobacteraceae bacterium]
MDCATPDVEAGRDRGHDHHGHSHAHADDGNRLLWALVLTGSFAVVEIVGGFFAHSLTLLADAGHMLTDAASLALAWVALRFASLPSDRRRTYGYQRLQVLAAFVNSILLLLATAWIVYEAIVRLRNPSNVAGPLMFAVAGGGLLINVAALLLLRRGDAHNLNLRAAVLHVLSDLLGSVGALMAALVIVFTGWMRVDPLLALLVAGLIVFSAGSLLMKSAHILLEGSPEWLDIAELERELRDAVAGVIDVHHVHVWSLTSRHPLLTLHARVDPGAESAVVLADIKVFLSRRYALEHSTIQLEAADCADH